MAKRNDDGFQNRSIVDILLSPFRAVKDWIGDAISGDDGFRDRDGFSIVKFLTFPLRLLWGFLVFMVQAWTTSRNGIAFLRGLPAFGILAFTPFLVWAFNTYAKQVSLGPTLGYHQMHLRNEAWDDAKMFAKKLVELRPDSKQYKYMLAEDYDRVGDNGEATRIMQYLAGDTNVSDITSTVDVTGTDTDGTETAEGIEALGDEESETEEPEKFAQAHVWLSQQLSRQSEPCRFAHHKSQIAGSRNQSPTGSEP